MVNRPSCIHGLHRPDEHGVCADCQGLTRVTGAVDGRSRCRTRAGKRFVPIQGIGEARRCPCGALATRKTDLSDLLQPWCDECRQSVAKDLIVEARGARPKIWQVVVELKRRDRARRVLSARGEHSRSVTT